MRNATNPAAKRTAVFAQMTAELQKTAKELQRRLLSEARGCILTRHNIGQQVLQVIQQDAKYGAGAVQQLAEFLGLDADYLYCLRDFALGFTREQLEKLVTREMANGDHISVSHLMAVLSVKGEQQRLELIKRIFEESLRVRAVADLIEASRVGPRKTANEGRKPARPKSPILGAQEILRISESLNRRFKPWTTGVFDALDKAGPATFDPQLTAKLQQADKQLALLSENIAAARERLARNLERANRVLDAGDQKGDAVVNKKSDADEFHPVEFPLLDIVNA